MYYHIENTFTSSAIHALSSFIEGQRINDVFSKDKLNYVLPFALYMRLAEEDVIKSNRFIGFDLKKQTFLT